MSRKARVTKKNFKVFCEGDTEYNYIDEMRRQKKLSIALKPVNMRGGGYGNFLEQIRIDGTTNCLAKFIIVDYPDFEYIACLHTPKYKGQTVAQYIIKELGYKSVDEFKANEKVYNVLNTNGNSYSLMLPLLKKENCFIINHPTINKKQYEIKVSTVCDWEKLGRRGSNINEFFEVLRSFYT